MKEKKNEKKKIWKFFKAKKKRERKELIKGKDRHKPVGRRNLYIIIYQKEEEEEEESSQYLYLSLYLDFVIAAFFSFLGEVDEQQQRRRRPTQQRRA